MVDLISYASLALPVVVFIVLSVIGRRWPKAATPAIWATLGLAVAVFAYAMLAIMIPALDPSSPDVFLGSFFFTASLLVGGVGTMLIVGVFGAAARFKTIRARRLAASSL